MSYCDCCNKVQSVRPVLKEVSDVKMIVQRKYNIVTCEKCGHSFINPMPSTNDEIIHYYPKNYYAHNTNIISPVNLKDKLKFGLIRLYYGCWSEDGVIRSLQEVFYLFLKHTINEPPIVSNGKLLDIGCGNGAYLNTARHFGWDTYGTELSKEAVYIAQSAGLKVRNGSAEETGYEACFFDVVKIWNVLEHTISPRKVLSEVVRILKRGGYLLLYVPNFNSVDRKHFGVFWASLEIPRHLHHFCDESLESYFKQVGLVIERRMYPGTLFSTLVPTIKIMRDNQINVFFIGAKVVRVIVKKIYSRLLGKYSGDVGICVLARKI